MRVDLILSALFTAFGAWMYWEATALPKGLFGTLGPGFFPKVILAPFTILCAILTIRLFLKWLRAPKKDATPEEERISWFKRYRFVLIGFTLFFLYLLGLKWLGFILSTLIFMPVFMWTLAPPERGWGTVRVVAFTTALLTFGLYGLFTYAFQVMLPPGVIFH